MSGAPDGRRSSRAVGVADEGVAGVIEQLTITGDVEDLWDQEFDQWWQGYPVKRDKVIARRKFRARRRQGVSLERLIRARDAYLAQATPGYIKYPATFLGVWDEWDVPPEAPQHRPDARLSPREVKFCSGCGEMAQYCLCGAGDLHQF